MNSIQTLPQSIMDHIFAVQETFTHQTASKALQHLTTPNMIGIEVPFLTQNQ
jgi:hypothetical protein